MKWQPTPVFFPRKFHGQRRLEGYCLWCHKQLDVTKHTFTLSIMHYIQGHKIFSVEIGLIWWQMSKTMLDIGIRRADLLPYIAVVVQSLSRCLTLRFHGLQHARPPCSWLSPRVCRSSCSLNQCCYPTISSSATLFSSCSQSFPASGSFPMSQLFAPAAGEGIQMVLWSVDPGHVSSLFGFALWTPRSSDRSQLLLLWPGAKFLVVTSGLCFLSWPHALNLLAFISSSLEVC